MKVLVLDDDINRLKEFTRRLIGHDVTLTTESKETIKYLKKEIFDCVFLDHDLGDKIHVASGEDTGYEVAQFLNENPDRQPERIVIHSFNHVGAKNMKALLPGAEVIPGAWLLIK